MRNIEIPEPVITVERNWFLEQERYPDEARLGQPRAWGDIVHSIYDVKIGDVSVYTHEIEHPYSFNETQQEDNERAALNAFAERLKRVLGS